MTKACQRKELLHSSRSSVVCLKTKKNDKIPTEIPEKSHEKFNSFGKDKCVNSALCADKTT